MIKKNNNGFALAETIIVSVFVASIFTLIFTNFFPLMGEYEKREGYDNVDSVYNTYTIKRMIESSNSIKDTAKSSVTSNSYYQYFHYDAGYGAQKEINLYDIKTSCSKIFTNDKEKSYCANLLKEMRVVSVYLFNYELTTIKTDKLGNSTFINSFKSYKDEDILDYIDSLPYYKKQYTNKKYNYRIVVKYIKEINKESQEGYKSQYSYSTIGVDI